MFTATRPRLRTAAVSVLASLVTACSSDDGPATRTQTSVASTAPSSEPAGPEARVEDVLSGLDRREQAAQLFVAGVPLDDLGSGDDLVRSGIGGLFLAGRSEAPAADLAAVAARWQSQSPGPGLWVAVDQEGGDVQALRGPDFGRLPSALDQAALPPAELAALAEDMGAALHDAGINLDLAPVADVVPPGTEAANPPIGAYDRHYGSTPESVTAAAGAVIDGLAKAQVSATLTHFPGPGRVRANPDRAADGSD